MIDIYNKKLATDVCQNNTFVRTNIKIDESKLFNKSL